MQPILLTLLSGAVRENFRTSFKHMFYRFRLKVPQSLWAWIKVEGKPHWEHHNIYTLCFLCKLTQWQDLDVHHCRLVHVSPSGYATVLFFLRQHTSLLQKITTHIHSPVLHFLDTVHWLHLLSVWRATITPSNMSGVLPLSIKIWQQIEGTFFFWLMYISLLYCSQFFSPTLYLTY